MALIETLILLIIVVWLLYKWSIAKYEIFKERGVPHDKPKPLIGNLSLGLLLGKSSLLQESINTHLKFKNSRVSGVYNLREPFFVVRDIELLKKIGIKDFDNFANHRDVHVESSETFLTKSLIALKDTKWKEMRNTLTPSFTGSKMRNMYGLINECSIEGVKYIKGEIGSDSNEIELEMKDYFTRFATDVIGTSAFGIHVNSFKDKTNQFFTLGKSVTQFTGLALFKAILFGVVPKLMKALRVRIFDQEKVNYFNELVFGAIKQRELHNIIRPDMIQLLMEAKREFEFRKANEEIGEHAQFNDEDLLAQCLLFFFAGYETVSNCLCFTTYELIKNPDVQQRLYEEILETELALNGKPLDYDTLKKMKYMDMVVSESLRKWPPGIGTDRQCSADYKLTDDEGNLVVEFKKNDVIFIPIIGLHHDPENFPNPEVFDPDRFSEENKSNIKAFTYLPFGLGRRSCIANRFALMEVKSIIYHLVLKFKLLPTAKTSSNLMEDLVGFRMQSKSMYWLKFEVRDN